MKWNFGAFVYISLSIFIMISPSAQQQSPQDISKTSLQVISVEEEQPPHTFIAQIGAGIPHISPLCVIYENENYVKDNLNISASGTIRVGRTSLDRETRSWYEFMAVCAHGHRVRVTINVTDINDNSPSFHDNFVALNISESSPPEVPYFVGYAVDRDLGANGTIRYAIIDGNSDEKFSLVEYSSGIDKLELKANDYLDYEVKESYSLTIRAYDAGIPRRFADIRINITIMDANDNQPTFSHSRYVVSVPEDTALGRQVLTVLAFDTDSGDNGRITYTIDRTRSDALEQFRINSTNGVITLNVELDYESTPTYELIVVARDNGWQSLQTSAIVSIRVGNVNDNPPTMKIAFLTASRDGRLSRNAKAGDFLARLSVSDRDLSDRDGTVRNSTSLNDSFQVFLLNDSGAFALKSVEKNEFLITVAQSLVMSDSSVSSHRLIITAVDKGTPRLTSTQSIDVVIDDDSEDIFDGLFRFSQDVYNATIPELSPSGFVVTRVHAMAIQTRDGYRGIEYSLHESTPMYVQDLFNVNSSTGALTTSVRTFCNTSQPRFLHVTVVSTLLNDALSTPMSRTAALVVIRVVGIGKRTPPVFEQNFYEYVLPSGVKVGDCIATVRKSNT